MDSTKEWGLQMRLDTVLSSSRHNRLVDRVSCCVIDRAVFLLGLAKCRLNWQLHNQTR